VLRKPGKPDYSLPGAYRPISLLNTLGKLLEAVIYHAWSIALDSTNKAYSVVRQQAVLFCQIGQSSRY
jgi:hypothetical protein